MGVNSETMLIVRAEICDKIDALAQGLNQLSPSQVARKVDDIRTSAQSYGMLPVAELARGFEKALAGSLSTLFARPFLDAMRDAVGCERVDPQISEAFLASINQRLYG